MEQVARAALPGVDKGGAWVQIGDKEYKVAPLNFKSLRTLAGEIGKLQQMKGGGMPDAEQMGILCRLAHASLQRNYPEMSEDEVADNLDFSNFGTVLKAVMGQAGLDKEEIKNPGEAPASP